MKIIKDIAIKESAQGMIEYSLVLSLIAIALIFSVIAFGGALSVLYEKIKEDVMKVV